MTYDPCKLKFVSIDDGEIELYEVEDVGNGVIHLKSAEEDTEHHVELLFSFKARNSAEAQLVVTLLESQDLYNTVFLGMTADDVQVRSVVI